MSNKEIKEKILELIEQIRERETINVGDSTDLDGIESYALQITE